METPPSGARMRLTVEVLPLAEENSFGPYRDVALAAFKGRKFALPVQLDDTIEQVWSQIEERYKRNYLTSVQAANFTIKVLQDAYDCDLDVGDTVRSLYEGEPDPAKRMIKVIPTFVYRDFSVPLTSNLRPASVRKRQRQSLVDSSSKRRRLEGERTGHDNRRDTEDRVIPSTESDFSIDLAPEINGENHIHSGGETVRSKSGSVIQTGSAHPGGEEFASALKEESPELGEPSARTTIPDSNLSSPHSSGIQTSTPLAPNAARPSQLAEGLTSPSLNPSVHRSPQTPNQSLTNGLHHEGLPARDAQTEEVERGLVEHVVETEDRDSVNQSPRSSSPEPTIIETAPLPVPILRKSVYEVSPTPEFLQSPSKPRATYARNAKTPRRQKSMEPANSARARSPRVLIQNTPIKVKMANGTVGMARRFRFADPDHIVSTPDIDGANEAQPMPVPDAAKQRDSGTVGTMTEKPQSDGVLEGTQPSKLKRPARRSYNMPPPKEETHKSSPRGRPATRGRSSSVAKRPMTAQSALSERTLTPVPSAQEKIQRIRETMRKRRESQGSQSTDVADGSSKHVPSSPTMARKQTTCSPDPRKEDEVGLSHKIPPKSSEGAEDKPVEQENNAARQRAEAVSRGRPARKSEVLSPKLSTPSQNNVTRSIEQSTPKLSNGFKIPARKLKKSSTMEPTPENAEPIPSNTDPATSSENSLPSSASAPKPKPRMSKIPPSENVRHIYASDGSATPEPKLSDNGDVAGNLAPNTSAPSASANAEDVSKPEALAEIQEHDTTKVTTEREHEQAEIISSGESSSSEYGSRDDEGELQAQLEAEVTQATVAEAVGRIAEKEAVPGEEPPLSPLPWDSSAAWDFDGIDGQDATPQEAVEASVSKAKDVVRSPSLSEPHATEEQIEEANAATRTTSPSEPNSTRSSPAAVRRPARFLSHSPTPQRTDSDDEDGDEDEKETPVPTNGDSPSAAVEEADTDTSSSTDSDTSTDSDQDIDMPDADTANPAIPEPLSSGPTLPSPPASKMPTQLPPSRPAVRRSEIPLSGTTTSRSEAPVSSSQPASQSQAQRPTPTPKPRSSQYTTLREQLNAARAGKATAARRQTFDPSTQSLNLLKKRKGAVNAKQALLDGDDDSEDESSSSSSDSD